MLYDDDGVSFVNKFVQYIHQYADIFKMKSDVYKRQAVDGADGL